MDKFFQLYREAFGKLRAAEEKSLGELLALLLKEKDLTIPQLSYVLATVKHETADTFRPIDEYGKGAGRKYGNPDPETGKVYYGRGYVQLTWKVNYQTFSDLLDVDLVNHPELANVNPYAEQILVKGMLKGLFTGKRLDHYINSQLTDFVSARRIINGADQANKIADYAVKFWKILNANS